MNNSITEDLKIQRSATVLKVLKDLQEKGRGGLEALLSDLSQLQLVGHESLYFQQFAEESERLFLDRFTLFLQNELERDEEEVGFSNSATSQLAEMLVIVGIADGLSDDEVDKIFDVIGSLWNGDPREVGNMLGDTFYQLKKRKKSGEDLVTRFKELCSSLEQSCSLKQKIRLLHIIEDFIGADDNVSIQEKMLYKIFNNTLSLDSAGY